MIIVKIILPDSIAVAYEIVEMRDRLGAALDGLLCVYKPPDLSLSGLKKSIIKRLCVQANAAVGWPRLPVIEMPIVDEHKSGALIVVGRRKQVDYCYHPLVVGETFRAEDIRLQELKHLETSSSGICVFGVNGGVDEIDKLRDQNWVSKWRIEAILGRETNKHDIKGKVTRREAYEHVSKPKLQRLLGKVKGDYRRMAFELAEVDIQSSQAFNLAMRGLPRPKLPDAQLLVNLRLILFKLPYFAIMADTIGETDAWLRCIVNEMGLALDTTASPTRLIRRSMGPFHVEHALLERQLSLQNIVDNISMCRTLLNEYNYDRDVVVDQPRDTGTEGIEKRKKILERMVGNELSVEEFDAMRPAWPREYI